MPDKNSNINFEIHLDNFQKLSEFISDFVERRNSPGKPMYECLTLAVEKSKVHNGFFTDQNIYFALNSLSKMLEKEKTEKWITKYKPLFKTKRNVARVGVVMAGNIPLVGFHDFLCVLISGNIFIGKLSQNDKFLLPAIAEILCKIDARYANLIYFTEDRLLGFDAVIATGSNNTSRYFEYYFEKYPHIIRKNRNSIAVLNGYETDEQMTLLADDIFSYFGLGCRNVSTVPIAYDFQRFIDAMKPWSFIINHHKYKNNYDYYKTIFIMNTMAIMDAGFFILNEEMSMYSPVSVINYEKYSDIKIVDSYIQENHNAIQCVVGDVSISSDIVSFGKSQLPELWNYADNIDTMAFLLTL